MECNDINDPALLVENFKSNDEHKITRVFNCFKKLFFRDFLYFSNKEILSKRSFTRFKEDELAAEAFNEGLLSFYLFIREKGFEDRGSRGATIKTFFFEFCKFKLLGLLKALKKHSDRQPGGDPGQIIENISGTDGYDYHAIYEEMDNMDKKEKLLVEAFKQLGERCTNLVRWRKLEKLNNEEISKRTGLDPGSVNNEVYKCIMRLKKIVNDLRA